MHSDLAQNVLLTHFTLQTSRGKSDSFHYGTCTVKLKHINGTHQALAL